MRFLDLWLVLGSIKTPRESTRLCWCNNMAWSLRVCVFVLLPEMQNAVLFWWHPNGNLPAYARHLEGALSVKFIQNGRLVCETPLEGYAFLCRIDRRSTLRCFFCYIAKKKDLTAQQNNQQTKKPNLFCVRKSKFKTQLFTPVTVSCLIISLRM